ncbi:hypothetical protein RI367_000014 [Sorochytrium milnesiophthora]
MVGLAPEFTGLTSIMTKYAELRERELSAAQEKYTATAAYHANQVAILKTLEAEVKLRKERDAATSAHRLAVQEAEQYKVNSDRQKTKFTVLKDTAGNVHTELMGDMVQSMLAIGLSHVQAEQLTVALSPLALNALGKLYSSQIATDNRLDEEFFRSQCCAKPSQTSSPVAPAPTTVSTGYSASASASASARASASAAAHPAVATARPDPASATAAATPDAIYNDDVDDTASTCLQTMTVATINTNGGADKTTIWHSFLGQMDKAGVQIVCLQETNLTPQACRHLRTPVDGWTVFYSCLGDKRKGSGVAIALKDRIAAHFMGMEDIHGYALAVHLAFRPRNLTVVCLYLAPADRQVIEPKIKELCAKQVRARAADDGLLVVAGDFNAAACPLADRSQQSSSAAAALPEGQLHQLMSDCGLMDAWRSAHPQGPGFSYSAKRPVSRINYVYSCHTLAMQLLSAVTLSAVVAVSADHLAVAATYDTDGDAPFDPQTLDQLCTDCVRCAANCKPDVTAEKINHLWEKWTQAILYAANQTLKWRRTTAPQSRVKPVGPRVDAVRFLFELCKSVRKGIMESSRAWDHAVKELRAGDFGQLPLGP